MNSIYDTDSRKERIVRKVPSVKVVIERMEKKHIDLRKNTERNTLMELN